MDEFIKILLGSEDVVLRENEDAFLNLELSRIAKEVKPDSVNNDFDLGDRYVKERNESLKFCVYGTVESKYSDCAGMIMEIRTSDNDTMFSPKKYSGSTGSKIHFIRTSPLSKGGSLSKNVYGKEKASYFFLFEIDRRDLERKAEAARASGRALKTDKVMVTIDDASRKIFDVIEIPFIFYDENGEFIQYGTRTTDINEDGSTSETNNDFPFFYDRHWIKSNIVPSKLASVSFRQAGTVVVVPENAFGGTFSAEVVLDFPSKLGRESVTVVLDSDETVRDPNSDFTFVPQTLRWGKGEVSKSFNVGIIDDRFVESNERLSFRLDNVTNAQLNKESDGRLTIEIRNDDIPSIINFRTPPLRISESASTASFEVYFDKPLEVSEQFIDVIVDTVGTTAILEQDFNMDVPNRPGALNKRLLFKEGDTGATFSINIIDDLKYELDKTITLRLANPSQNIEIGGQTPTATITVTDSIAKNFTRYVMPADPQNGTGAFRVNRKVTDEKYEWSVSGNEAAFTNSFPFELEVFNLGEPIVFDGRVIDGVGAIESQRLVFSKKFTTGMTSPLVLDLPANETLDAGAKAFRNTKYQFVFSDIFSDVNIQTEGANVFQNNTYEDVRMVAEVKPASGVGVSVFHLISEITNIKSSYNPSNNGCRTSLDTATSNVKINGIAFLPKTSLQFNSSALAQATKVKPLFRNRPVQNHCDFNGLLLPFGFGPAADPPFAERLVSLSFRDIFVQADNFPNNNSNLVLASRVGTPSTELRRGFYKWSDASQRTKNEMEMHITNLGSKNVKILGHDAGGGDTVVIRQSDVDFDFGGMRITLEGNTSYSLSANSFNESSYAISFKNVNFYDIDEKFIRGPVEFNIQPFKLSASTRNIGIPEYVLVSQYEDVTLGSNGFGQNLCSGSVFDTPKDIAVKGMLLNNSNTDFVGASFVKTGEDIAPTCPTSPFQHLILNP